MAERVSEAKGAGATDEFAALLRELKERAGLSYGTLAKRLHMSTSTLHRYCNGTAMPNEYAPAERLARVCRATPQELMELHRRWILADAVRRGRPDRATAAGGSPEAAAAGPAADSAGAASTYVRGKDTEPVAVDVPREPAPLWRRRNALIASAALAAVLGAVVLAVNGPFGGGGREDGAGERRAGDTAAAITGSGDITVPAWTYPAPDTTSPPPSDKILGPSASTSASTSTSGSTAAPLNVATRPYVYEDPCSQNFLVDSEPAQVGPPANEQDAPRWAAAYGAVSSGTQRVALTVQGAGRDTVVLEALHVRVVTKGAPLAWNDYSMGVGCGGGVGTKSFAIDLDVGSPTVTVKNGQRDFPYKVSESDPEVFYITAQVRAHDVRWDLSLDWSSGNRRGTVRIDNDGTPFRTSAGLGRPGYDYPLGGSEWIERVG
ncbi:helix-turn-helix domain-containing protein [Streptomyces sp. NPDC087658]|uniref:helix-turn-helix domain-containing protein n=1 Tax=Streptomyces sp. NPDC087658 TaxID=3365800 RepID=UPI00380C011B